MTSTEGSRHTWPQPQGTSGTVAALRRASSTWSLRSTLLVAAAVLLVLTGPAVVPAAASPPAAPTGLLSSGLSASAIRLTWAAVPGATSYSVLRSVTANGSYATVGTSMSATYTDAGLRPGKSFSYKVQAVDGTGVSSTSSATTSTTATGTGAPGLPEGLAAAGTSATRVDLRWTVQDGAQSYAVLRAPSPGGPFVRVGGSAGTSFADKTVTTGRTYVYALRAVGATDTSGTTTRITVMTATASGAPASPTGLSATASSPTSLALRWTAVPGAASYQVLVSPTAGGPYTEVAGTSTTASWTVTGLQPQRAYYAVVRSVRGTEMSGSSLPATAQTSGLSAPTGLVATATPGRVDLRWTATTGAAGYQVLRSTTSGGPFAVLGTAGTAEYADSSVTAGTVYFYVVRAVAGTAGSPVSAEVRVASCGNTDLPDLSFADDDCDGLDGTVGRAVFVSPTGSDAAAGTRSAPLRTVTAGVMAAAAATPVRDVYVAEGAYDEGPGVPLATGVAVYGGYTGPDWQRSATARSVVTGAPQAALADGDTGVVLQLLGLRGQAPSGSPGTSVYGLRAVSGAEVVLQAVDVAAAAAPPGAGGAAGAAGTSGGAGGHGMGGSCDEEFLSVGGGPGSSPTGAVGGHGGKGGTGLQDGASGTFGSGPAGTAGVAGGRPGWGGQHNDEWGAGQPGEVGTSGSPGAAGAPGTGGSSDPAATETTWQGASGTAGAAGTAGSGGGGGGGGGGQGGDFYDDGTGNGGGGGGGGGTGGGAGQGGSSGGGSFGIYAWSASVRVLAESIVRSGAGGTGGRGGSGGMPGSGGQGGAGGSVCTGEVGAGGDGGDGGAGGAGGPGGGGAGGPSVAVLIAGSGTVAVASSTLVAGAPGAGGAGAPGADAGSVGLSGELVELGP